LRNVRPIYEIGFRAAHSEPREDVLLALANHADDASGYCYLRIETLMTESSCSSIGAFLGAIA
jgi:hypothetical protein